MMTIIILALISEHACIIHPKGLLVFKLFII